MTDIGVDNISTKNVLVTPPPGNHWWCLEFNEDTQLAEIQYKEGYVNYVGNYESANKKNADSTLTNCITHYQGKTLYGKIIGVKIHADSPSGHITARRAT